MTKQKYMDFYSKTGELIKTVKLKRKEGDGTKTAKKYEWANLTGLYDNIFDYVRLCCSCHKKKDGIIKNITRGGKA